MTEITFKRFEKDYFLKQEWFSVKCLLASAIEIALNLKRNMTINYLNEDSYKTSTFTFLPFKCLSLSLLLFKVV